MKITVLGAGAWGTALAIAFSARHTVTLWARKADVRSVLSADRENRRLLPAHLFPETLRIGDDFAAAIGLGRTKLFEKIKGLTGQTPNDFIQTIRMNKAAELLVKSPELTISEIAYLVGFNSPKYFSSCFRRHF
ncbi:MAG TPA: helix-turn-helix domain-containing protein, partial [Opitutaceae bacterium]|nr:helix-turn-helix domain-containing protein [Opitutaceae bacterium]